MNILLRPQRNLDIKGASLLQQKILNLMPIPEHSVWVIDLIEVNTIDHFGLTALVAIRKVARQHQCRLFLLNMKPSVRSMLEITELDLEFDEIDSLEYAFDAKIHLVLC
ncbi:STAS domain-containing protein [Oscillatoria sp. FACHB-1406]|uniref:STAS domain-containing protein n=1 Tax=Oscillatoria sp. FACHB-1406 TaxID=2692846 RepID=UPI001684629C|nr:STAS domain-containing protein [Oscillatoria sp. FACHB-1406]MBD2579946.1 STAS domain-containing protein [Oscillatoria sp. FACHB-1406]